MTIQKIHYFEQIIEIGSNWERHFWAEEIDFSKNRNSNFDRRIQKGPGRIPLY